MAEKRNRGEQTEQVTQRPAAQDTERQEEQNVTDVDLAAEHRQAREAGAGETGPGVADSGENLRLEHSQGGPTTRDDLLDAGVPMLQGSPDEPVGPEDALGPGPKRGDYRERIVTNPHQSEPIPVDEQVPGGPTSRLVAQYPRTEEIGDEPARKGGVDSAV